MSGGTLEERARTASANWCGDETGQDLAQAFINFGREIAEEAAKIAEMDTVSIASRHEIAAAIRAYAEGK